jgi:hypothetical protein
MYRYCSFCGTKIKKGSNFCEGCGREITDEKVKKEEYSSKGGLVIYPLSLSKTKKVFYISLIIAIAIIAITIIVGVFVLNSVDTTNKVFDIELGWPAGWFQISHLDPESNFSIGISNWINFVGDFVFYLLLCFGLSYLSEMLYESIKSKNKPKT